jgi:predicted Zn-dependent protease
VLGGGHGDEEHCNYAQEAAEQMGFALDLLEARGDIAPDSPEAEAFVQAVIKDVIMHEVGHTLGLKHNFKASTTVTASSSRTRPGPRPTASPAR